MKPNKPQLLHGIFLVLFCSAQCFAAPIFTPGSQPTGWLARPATSSIDLSNGNEKFFHLDYNKDTWSGDVIAKNINASAQVQTTGPWDNNDPTLTKAATLLELADYDTGRKIVTRDGSSNIPFRWANLSSAQQSSIGDATAGPNIVNFIRGDRSNEEPNGESYRARDTVMGDMLHSSLHYWSHSETVKRLYAGTNDGMLHVFDANTGDEIFAYIPSMLISQLNKLTAIPYVHTHFVDGPIGILNLDISGTSKTLLVGGLGAGGKGLYALDITDPTAANESAAAGKILWEIPASGDFANLGYTYGTPRITRLNDGTAAVIVGNGYMNGGDGHAWLYVINVSTGALIKAIDTGSGSAASPNGLATPTLFDSNSDGKIDYAYAGDIDGHLWKFDLSSSTSSNFSVVDKDAATSGIQPLFTTSPAQAITTAPAVAAHPSGGVMVAFATGKILTTGDQSDTAVHYVYGVWDGAPAANNQLLSQTLTLGAFNAGAIRTVTANSPDWTSGTGHHYGWKVALPAGERVVGEMPFYNNGRFYFLSTNPTITNPTPPNGENWLNEIAFFSGGSPLAPIFDLNSDNAFNSSDLATDCTPDAATFVTCVPVSKFLGAGVFSQPTFVDANGFSTTLYVHHSDLSTATSTVAPYDPGVSGGHFDFDIYYYGTITTYIPTTASQTKNICASTSNVANEFNELSPTYCTTAKGFSSGYNFLSKYVTGSRCGSGRKYQSITCNTYTTETTPGAYAYKKHVHEYDDIYDVTGVNMLNASNTSFNLSNAITDTTTSFKILVMNQYLNPAAKISVGGATYESVKTYKNLASETDAATLLSGLPTYTRANIGTLIYNLPLDAFKAKDWWEDGGAVRSGLMPTDWSCVTSLNADGSMKNTGINTTNHYGLPGPNGERFNGALAIQIIKSDTPASALELNYAAGGAKYGWRVKQANFTTYVLAEYTSYWHHPTDICYGETGWVADAAEDLVSDATAKTPATGSADPQDGIFSGGMAIVSTNTTVSGNTTTTVTTYSDGLTYTKVEVVNGSSITTTQTYRDGTTEVTTTNSGVSASASFTDTNSGSPEEETTTGKTGRQSWRELFQ